MRKRAGSTPVTRTIDLDLQINCSPQPENSTFGDMKDIISADAPEDIYISPVGCYGIVRRKLERNTSINPRLEEVLLSISSQMSADEIEKRSRVQHRGRFSNAYEPDIFYVKTINANSIQEQLLQISLFE